MKKLGTTLLITFVLLTMYSCEQKTPIDYYNSAVSRSNKSSNFFLQMDQAIRDREAGQYTNYDLVNGLKIPIEHIAYEITQLKELKGNEASDNLIQAAIESAQYEYELASSDELKTVYKIIDDAPNLAQLQKNITLHADYLDTIMAKSNMLFEKLSSEITKYAKENNIQENIIAVP